MRRTARGRCGSVYARVHVVCQAAHTAGRHLEWQACYTRRAPDNLPSATNHESRDRIAVQKVPHTAYPTVLLTQVDHIFWKSNFTAQVTALVARLNTTQVGHVPKEKGL